VNGLLVIVALMLVGFGTFIDIPFLILLSKNYFGSLSALVGASTSFVSCCGFFSAFLGSIYGLVVYAMMLFLIFVVEVVAIVFFYSSESQTKSILHSF
jgi:hypothetical protein